MFIRIAACLVFALTAHAVAIPAIIVLTGSAQQVGDTLAQMAVDSHLLPSVEPLVANR